LEPCAYGLRVRHEVFRTPIAIDVKQTTPHDTPEAWKGEVRDKTVAVLPLARHGKKGRAPGWCTYTYEHEQAPELEVLCGGLNSRRRGAGPGGRRAPLPPSAPPRPRPERTGAGGPLPATAAPPSPPSPGARRAVRPRWLSAGGGGFSARAGAPRRLRGSDEDL